MTLILLSLLAIVLSSPGVMSLGENCTSNMDCVTSNSVCEKGICGCDEMSYYSTNFKSCLTYAIEYKEFCLETKQCVDFVGDHSGCERNYCMCQENYRWFQGRCQPSIQKGDTCTSNSDCYDGNDPLDMNCINGTCVCADEYYDRGQDCRPSAPADSSCAINFDCQDEGYTCYNGRCKSLAILHSDFFESIQNPTILYKHRAKRSIFYWNENMTQCFYDYDCVNISNAECVSGGCLCKEGYFLHGDQCLKGLQYCGNGNECTINNTMCLLNTSCVCKRGYFLSEDICIPELGVADPNYTDADQCTITGAINLINNACYCFNFWYQDDTNRKCIKTSTQQYDACLTNDWCNVMGPYSYCELNDTITTGECRCSSFAELNTTTFFCEKYSEMTNGSCLRDTDCSFNQMCHNEKCVCEPYFKEDESGACMPVIYGDCTVRPCSLIKHSTCVGGYCICPEDTSVTETACLKFADNVDEPCEMDVQCERLNAVCNGKQDNKTCVCKEGYVDVGGIICMENREYGSACSIETECTLVLNHSFQCRNNICQCPVNQTLKNGYCTPSAASYMTVNFTLITMCVVIAWRVF